MTARSGYRFVPIDNAIVEPPVSFEDLCLDTPHKDGTISGTLDIDWMAETPVCIGVDCGGGNVHPFEIGGRGVIPGSSLRGMLRAVMEIATFSHLGRINDHRHFGFRDFTVVPANNIKAGWLNYSAGKWTLTVASRGGHIFPIEFSDVLDHINSYIGADKWLTMGIHDKRLHFDQQATQSPNLLDKINFKQGAPYHNHGGTNCLRGAFPNPDQPGGAMYPGYVVVGGAATPTSAARANDVIIGQPSELRKHQYVLQDDFMSLFHRINSNPGRLNPEPAGAWRYWLGQKAHCSGLFTERGTGSPNDPFDPPRPITKCKLPGIPVFFCGDPCTVSKGNGYDPSTSNFAMGLSRVIKIPYREGVSQVAARLYCGHSFQSGRSTYRVPKLKESFDFAKAIFGWIEKPEDQPEDQPTAQTQIEALAGRVAFSPAFIERSPEGAPEMTLVFGAPRESFYRFYLAGDYGGEGPGGRPVGRKRYPVRPRAGGADGTATTQTKLKFHSCGTVYRGRIRIHNLHPVELGALIWCLGFGKISGPWRHSIGRGKGYGFGRLKLSAVKWRPGSLQLANMPEGALPNDFDALAAAFQKYMDRKLCGAGPFADHEAIRKLRGYAHPGNGKRYAKNPHGPSGLIRPVE